MDSRFFEFNGIKSNTVGVHIVRVDGGRSEVPLWSSTTVTPARSVKRQYVDAYDIDREPLRFDLTIMLMDEDGYPKPWTREDKALVSEWLIHDEYKPLMFGHDPDKLYYAIVVDASTIFSTGHDGYMDITMETNSPFGWTIPKYYLFDCTKNNTFEIDAMHNVGKYYNPEIEIQMHGDSQSVSVTNLTINETTTVSKLLKEENFYIDSENKVIQSGKPMRNLFKNFNRVFPRLIRGLNVFEVNGDCEILIRAQYPIL